jgi:hypothetical protein
MLVTSSRLRSYTHVAEGSGRKVIPQVAKLAGHRHSLGSGIMDAGELCPYMFSIETVAVVDVKIAPGHAESKPKVLTKAKASMRDLRDGLGQVLTQERLLDANGVAIAIDEPF